MEISILEKRQELPPTSKLRQLQVFLDNNGLLRIGGRLEHSDLDYNQKYPILLDKEDRLTALLDLEIHHRLFCSGLNHVLNELRKNYWILSMRQTVKNVLHKCMQCKIRKPAHIYEKSPPLPQERLISSKPFENSFIDIFGHFFVKDEAVINKLWCLLFVCCKFRSVHTEILLRKDTLEVLDAIRRYICRRDAIRNIFADQKRSFLNADRHIREMYNVISTKKLQNSLNQTGMTFHFNIPYACHRMGAIERIVGVTKRILKAKLTRSYLST